MMLSWRVNEDLFEEACWEQAVGVEGIPRSVPAAKDLSGRPRVVADDQVDLGVIPNRSPCEWRTLPELRRRYQKGVLDPQLC